MNIFYLDKDPELAAQMLCDKHVVKMILETAQLLCTAHHVLGTNTAEMYKITNKNHPCAIWVRSTWGNYEWTFSYFLCLLEEYTYRYKKKHACEKLIGVLGNNPLSLVRHSFTNPLFFFESSPPQCMPDKYKQEDTVSAYRAYYKGEKAHFAKWTKREVPLWWVLSINSTEKSSGNF